MVDYQQRFLTRQGHRLGYHRYPSDADLAVVVLPAMGVPAGYYRRFALELAATGADITVADLRGTGSSTPRPTRAIDFGYAELLDDVGELFARVGAELGGRRTLLIGHSLGGQLATLHLAQIARIGTPGPLPVTALALIACGLPYHGLYGIRGPVIHALSTIMNVVSSVRGHWPGYGFGGRQPRRLIRDWSRTIHRGTFVPLDGVDPGTDLERITQPVLAVTVDTDGLTPPATSRRLTDLLTGTSVTEYHYTAQEAGRRLDHFTWAQASAPLAPRIRAFVDALPAAR